MTKKQKLVRKRGETSALSDQKAEVGQKKGRDESSQWTKKQKLVRKRGETGALSDQKAEVGQKKGRDEELSITQKEETEAVRMIH